MHGDPIELHKSRSSSKMMATNIRRYSRREVGADQTAIRSRQEAFENQLRAEPAETWPEAAERSRYSIEPFAETAEGQDARRNDLTERAISDLDGLLLGGGARKSTDVASLSTDNPDKPEGKERNCLRCHKSFPSEWAGERICRRCKSTNAWRLGTPTHYSSVNGRR